MLHLFRTKSVEQTIAETGEEGHELKRNLKWWDLAIMGVAVAVGAGIFSVGAQAAAFHAGPAVIISFIIAGVVCGAAVMCYAEFASMIPVAGSAYTFTYTTVGEIVAWIIGWDLILEMLMAGSVISKYWGVYLNDFFDLMGWDFDTHLAIGPFTIDVAPAVIVRVLHHAAGVRHQAGCARRRGDDRAQDRHRAVRGHRRFLLRQGRELHAIHPPSEPSTSSEAVMNQPLWQWVTGMTPSIYGVPGILSGAALVFFAFLGFDVVATASEEAESPKRNVPLGIGVGLVLVVVLYMLVAIVTTGMVSYKDLAAQPDPSLATAIRTGRRHLGGQGSSASASCWDWPP